jgi:Sulfotransferase domain
VVSLRDGAKAALRPALRRFRVATSRHRILPSFLIIGAQRAGTTSLFHYLEQHPEVAAPSGGDPSVWWSKELHYFDKRYARGLEWYRSFFPLEVTRRGARVRGRDLVAGEASPYYLFHPEVPARVAEVLPDVRLIALLRDPIERAYSHYQLSRRQGIEHLPFEQAIAAEEKRLAETGASKEAARLRRARIARNRRSVRSYLSRGLYAEQLERWYAHFPREQILVLRTEDMQADPAAVYGQVLDHLGLTHWSPPDFVQRNRASYAPIDPVLRERLEERFVEPNARLAELLGRDFGWTAPGADGRRSEATPDAAIITRHAREG